jgi:MFS family permease
METFFKKDRAKYMGVWTLLLTLGIPCGPFIFGFVTYRASYIWIYWVLAIVSVSISARDLLSDHKIRSMVFSSSCISSSARKLGISGTPRILKSLRGRESMFRFDGLTQHLSNGLSSSSRWDCV